MSPTRPLQHALHAGGHAGLRPRPLVLALACALGLPGQAPAQSLPTGATVVRGQATVVTQGQRMTIGASDNAVLSWQSFSVGAGQTVRFDLPSASSKVLNRVLGRDPSTIAGTLSSNGQVWLLNPYGVLFGAGARVDVAGLVASTLNINDADWQARRYSLTGGGPGVVSNQGEIRTTLGGRVLLLGGGAGVRNEGLIEAPGGQIMLAAGASIDLADSQSPQVAVRVTAPAGEAINLGRVLAPGGRVDLAAAMVNQQGIVRADGLSQGPGGEVRLSASGAVTLSAGSQTGADGGDGGRVDVQGASTLVSGAVSADGIAGRGGSVRLLGQEVGVLGGALVSASGQAGGGEVLIGGGLQGKDATAAHARAVYLATGATVRADATGRGDGGTVVLWSDHATRAYGHLSAQGGAEGGDGGLIETSGGWLDARPASIRTQAPRGRAGQWLLDPNDILIASGEVTEGNVTGGPNFTTTNDSAILSTDSLAGALNTGNSVTVSTGSGGTNAQAGNIRMHGGLVVVPPPGVSLTLNAARHIDLDQATISSSGAPLNLTLNAGLGGEGGIRLIASQITNAGNVTLGGASVACGTAGCAPFAAATGTSDAGRGYGVSIEGSTIRADRILVRGASSIDTQEHGGVRIDSASRLSAREIDIAGWAGSAAFSPQYGVRHDGAIEALDRVTLDGTSRVSGAGDIEGTAIGVGLGGSSAVFVGPETQTGQFTGAHAVADRRFGLAADPNRWLRISGRSDAVQGSTDSVAVDGEIWVTDKAGVSITGDGGIVTMAGFGFDTQRAGNLLIGGNSKLVLSMTGALLPTGESVRLGNTLGVDYFGSMSGLPSQMAIDSPSSVVSFCGQCGPATLAIGPSALTIRASDFQFGVSGDPVSASAGSVRILATRVSLGQGAQIQASGTGDAITVAGLSGNTSSFLVAQGANPLHAANGRWLVYALDPVNGAPFQAGALSYDFKQYAAVFGVDSPVRPDNGLLFAAAPELRVSGGVLGPVEKVYDGTTTSTAVVSGGIVTGLFTGDQLVSAPQIGGLRYASAHAGNSIPLLVSLAGGMPAIQDANGKPVFGYGLNPTLGGVTGRISRRPVQLVSLEGVDKTYDGTRAASVRSPVLSGLVAGESLTVVPDTLLFDSADAGRNRAVTGTVGLADGNSGRASDYLLTGGGRVETTASILPKPLSLTGLGANDKVYDGTTAATLRLGPLSGLVGDETLTVVVSAANFDTADAGPAKLVTGVLSLADGANRGLASNYALVGGDRVSTRGSITPRPLTLAGVGTLDKVYDGSADAGAIRDASLVGLVAGERLTLLSKTLRFDTPDAGTGKPVTGTVGLGDGPGGLARNYTLTGDGAVSTTGSITPRPLTLGPVAVFDKTYDGSVDARFRSAVLLGLVADQTLSLSADAVRFDTPGAGIDKIVTGQLRLADGDHGGKAANYTLIGDGRFVSAGSISPRPLVLAGARASDRVYDGTLVATVSAVGLQGLVAGESLQFGASGRFSTPDVGNAKEVAVDVVLGDGTNGRASNYIVERSTLSANVLPRPVSAEGLFAADKVYDGTDLASVAARGFSGLVPGETLTLASQARFDSRNVGNGRTVSGTLTLADGSGRARNYVLTNADRITATASILPRGLVVGSASAADKVYDAGLSATVSDFTLQGVLAGEQVSVVGGSGRFSDPNVGRDKVVVATASTLGGADAGNYSLVQPSVQTRASISPATLTYVADGVQWPQAYPLPRLAGSVSGLAGSDTLASATTGTLSFATTGTQDSPPGRYPVQGGGLSARNYVFSQAPGNATALAIVPIWTSKIGEHVSTVPTVPTLLSGVQPASVVSSVASHRTLDVLPSLQSAPPSLSFRSLDLDGADQQQLSSMLAARDRYKKAIFADAIRELEKNPGAADVPACQTVEQAAAGNCLITDAIKPALRERVLLERQAPPPLPAVVSAQPPAAPAAPAAAEAASASAPAVAAAPAVMPPAPAVVAPAREPSAVAAASDLSIRIPAVRAVRSAALPQIQRKWALLIGTDRYADGRIPQLDNAVADVEAVANVLEASLGYQTLVVRNGSKSAIVRAFNQLAAVVAPSDSVAIYYAGHGELVEKIGLGFWQPSDADATRAETWISNTDIGKLLGQLGASQVVLVSDSCFSGSLVSDERIRAGGAAPDAAALLSRRAAVVMSSGGNEPVFDSGKNGHSAFAWSFMRALERVNTWRPGSNVFEQVRFAVARQVPQRPQYGASRLGGHQSGADYVFEQRQLDASPK